jgi:hypothetical protein
VLNEVFGSDQDERSQTGDERDNRCDEENSVKAGGER